MGVSGELRRIYAQQAPSKAQANENQAMQILHALLTNPDAFT